MKTRSRNRYLKNTVRFVASLLFILYFAFLHSCSLTTNYSNVRVKEVVDGDTIVLANGQHVRYIGLDTPETRKRVLDTWVYKPQPFAEAAKEFNKNLVEGKSIRLEFDVQNKDKYDRLLAYCFVDDVLVNAKLLEEGLAVLYTSPPNIKYVDILVDAQRKARQNNKGIWQKDLVIDARDASKSEGAIKVVRGKVTGVFKTGSLFKINLGSGHKKECSIVIFRENLPFFVSQGVSIEKDYRNKIVLVSGLIKEYKGEPEIIVRHPSQIEILE